MAGNKVTKSQKKNARRRAKVQGSVVHARGLLRGQLPKPYMKIREGNMDQVTISGLEVVAGLFTSQVSVTNAVGLSPARADVFPRLSTFALQYERFRFGRVRLHFYTTCPATRSGSVGIALHTEYTTAANVETSYPQFAAYEYSALGAVSESMSTPTWVVKDPEWFYIGSGTLASTDILKIFQGSIVGLTADCVAADAGLIAGYVGIEYEVSFRSFRPTPQRCSNISNTGDVTLTGGSAKIIPALSYDGVDVTGQSVGFFDHRMLDDVADATTVATFNSADKTKAIWDGVKAGASWVWDYYVSVNSGVAETKTLSSSFPCAKKERNMFLLKPNQTGFHRSKPIPFAEDVKDVNVETKSDSWFAVDEKGLQVPPNTRRHTLASSRVAVESVSGYYNPQFISNPPSGYVPYPQDALDAGHNCEDVLKAKGLLPEASGDLTISWYGYSTLNGQVNAIISDVYSGIGTGAQTLGDSHIVTLPAGYTVAWLTLVPTGTEVRTVTANTQTFVAYDE